MEPETQTRGLIFWIIVAAIAAAAISIGYFGYNYFTQRAAKTPTTTKTTATTDSSLDQPITPEPDATITTTTTPATVTTDKTTTTTTGNTTTTPTVVTTTVPVVAPTITAASTGDTDYDGKIDNIKLIFSTGMNTSITSTGGLKVSGYTIDKVNWADATTLNISLKESGYSDTDATPTFTYTTSTGKLKSASAGVLADTTLKAKDLASPAVVSAVASDANGTSGIQAGDKVVITFSEPVKTDPSITASNINQILPLNNSHSWKDGAEKIGSVSVSLDNKTITIVLSATTSAPTVAVNDSIHIYAGENSIQDLSGNQINNTDNKVQITGSF